MNTPSSSPSRLRGAWPLWFLAAFFGVIFFANGVLVYLATTSWSGLSTEDAYEKGRLYNNDIAIAKRQEALGWQAMASVQPSRIELTLKDKSGQAIKAATVRVTLLRPTREGHDFKLTLREAASGMYFSNVEFPLPGQWDADFRVQKGDDTFRLKQRFTVK